LSIFFLVPYNVAKVLDYTLAEILRNLRLCRPYLPPRTLHSNTCISGLWHLHDIRRPRCIWCGVFPTPSKARVLPRTRALGLLHRFNGCEWGPLAIPALKVIWLNWFRGGHRATIDISAGARCEPFRFFADLATAQRPTLRFFDLHDPIAA